MSARKRTALVALAILVAVVLWESFALSGHAWTFSRLVWACTERPLFSLAVGIFVGHFFFQKEDCLHCGFRPYRRDRLSEAAFDSALTTFKAAMYIGRPFPAAKRAAGLPDFEVKQ